MTTIHLHDPKTADAPLTPLPISALIIAAWNLLEEASDLPQPRYIGVSGGSQSISLQFPPDAASYRAVVRWALRFGAVIASNPLPDDGKGPRTVLRADFDYYGICADAYAVLPADIAA